MRILITLIILLLTSCAATKQPSPKIKNVILLIGDGMGLTQMSTVYYFNNPNPPSFNRFKVIGLSNTSSAKQKVTDSAAGATAFAAGIKTYNGAISVDTSRTNVQTIVERLEPKGISTGVIATSTITHATPACFYAHVPSRNMHEEIAAQLASSGIDFFAGGGLKYFTARKDSIDLLAKFAENGFEIDTTRSFPPGRIDGSKKYGFFHAANALPSKLEGRGDFLSIATKTAINHLSQNEKGFFLMVEGSQIDWEGHAKNSDGIVQEVRDFDKAIGVALDFAKQNGNTLVIVTADHETGGYALTPKIVDRAADYKYMEGRFYDGSKDQSSASHTTSLVPVFASGPGADAFAGIYQNTDIFYKMVNQLGW